MADQLGAAALGCYGSGVDSTPTLDALAEQGVRFDRCYATAPVCAPNRATILTGRSPVVHGIISNNYVLATDMPTYAQVLRAHGYRTGGFGKFHQTPMHCPVPEDLAYLGFDESLVTEDPKWPWLDWVEREHPEHYEWALSMVWPWPNHPRPDKGPLADRAREERLAPLRRRSAWGMMYPSPLPPEVHDTTYITDLGLDFMRRHGAEHGDRPFFCHVSYVDPHDPYDPPEPYAGMYDPGDMSDALPAEWVGQGFQTLRASQRLFRGFDEIWTKPDVLRQWRALYHGSLRYMDDQIARLVDHLHASGLWENTVLVFTTDHGEMLGDHGLYTKGVKHYDKGIRCPLIVAGGPVSASINGPATDRLTCTLDFYPTFCDWAGVAPEDRPPLEGKSFAGLCHAAEEGSGAAETGKGTPGGEAWREVSVAIGTVESVVTDDGWRLTRYLADDRGQMFNLVEDPGEQHNLYDDPAYAAKRQQLLERLVRAMAAPRLVPQYRNLPLVDGRKRIPVGSQFASGSPLYPSTPSPYLVEDGADQAQQQKEYRDA
jgi:arylsulfatase A-like enzyme